MIEKDIIQDQKETIHRLQEECKEKTDIIMALEQKTKADNKQIELDAECIANYIKDITKLKQENTELKIQNALLFLWINCALSRINAQIYRDIDRDFKNELKKLGVKDVEKMY